MDREKKEKNLTEKEALSHEEIQSLLWDIADKKNGKETAEDVSDEDISAAEEHLSSCLECREELERIMKLKEALSLSYEPNESLSIKLDEAVRNAPRRRTSRIPRHLGTIAAAAAIVLLFGATRLIPHMQGSTAPEECASTCTGLNGNMDNTHLAEAYKEADDRSFDAEEYESSDRVSPEEVLTPSFDGSSYEPGKIENSGFNYICVSGTDTARLIKLLSDNGFALDEDVTVTSKQIAVAEDDIDAVKALLTDSSVKIKTFNEGRYPKFTLIEIK